MKHLLYLHFINHRYEKIMYSYLEKYHGIKHKEIGIFCFTDKITSKTIMGAVSSNAYDKRAEEIIDIIRSFRTKIRRS